jgi:hypothetical protein
MEKLSIHNEMREMDRKNRRFYDELTDEERKKFSNYLMIRWGSTVQGSRELQEFYVLSINENLNRHFFAINRHPKLQWLCATAATLGQGQPRHAWIASKKKNGDTNELRKMLTELYPNMKLSDIETLAAITDKKELKAYLASHGRES